MDQAAYRASISAEANARRERTAIEVAEFVRAAPSHPIKRGQLHERFRSAALGPAIQIAKDRGWVRVETSGPSALRGFYPPSPPPAPAGEQ